MPTGNHLHDLLNSRKHGQAITGQGESTLVFLPI